MLKRNSINMIKNFNNIYINNKYLTSSNTLMNNNVFANDENSNICNEKKSCSKVLLTVSAKYMLKFI